MWPGCARQPAGALARARALGGDVVFRYDTLVNGFSADVPAGRGGSSPRAPTCARCSRSRSSTTLNETQRPVHRRHEGLEEARRPRPGDHRRRRRHRHRLHARELRRPRDGRRLRGERPERDRAGHLPDEEGDRRLRPRRLATTTCSTRTRPTTSRSPTPTRSTAWTTTTARTPPAPAAAIGVKGEIGPGVAPKAKLLAIKVWDEGDSTDDVLVAGYERAMDPNNDGKHQRRRRRSHLLGRGRLRNRELGRGRSPRSGWSTWEPCSSPRRATPATSRSAAPPTSPARRRTRPGVISVAASIDQFNGPDDLVDSPLARPARRRDHGRPGLRRRLPRRRPHLRPLRRRASSTRRPIPGNEIGRRRAVLLPDARRDRLRARSCWSSRARPARATAPARRRPTTPSRRARRRSILISLLRRRAESALSTDGEPITIPVVMISGNDGYAILDDAQPRRRPDNSGTGQRDAQRRHDCHPVRTRTR